MTMASDPSADVLAYYDRYPEEERLSSGAFQLEFERTRQILTRVLPKPPARVLDVGGAAGTYSLWLASQGYETHLADASERLVNEARRRSQAADRPIASLQTADARHLPHPDASMSAVLVMGPLYHLTSRDDRRQALREARRVLTAGFSNVRVLGVEGPAGFLPDFEARWADPLARADIIELAGLVEAEPSIVGTSAHLLAIGSV